MKWAAESSSGQTALRSAYPVFSNAAREDKRIRTTGRGYRVHSGQSQRVEAVFPEGECGCVMDGCLLNDRKS